MFFKFLPKEFNFFDLFEKQARYAVEAAGYFKEIVQKSSIDESALDRMHRLEHDSDEVTHEIFERLNKTFITPFDREDIHALAKELDDIVDMIYTIVNRLKIYNVSGDRKNLIEFASVINESARAVECAIKGLRNTKNLGLVRESCVEVNRLENVGDTMRDKMLEGLFESEKDPINLIKWKDIYQDAETVLDICEDVAHIVQNILVKQA
jgi:predicted phosphate transport protein (TIGR00153 family)